jgi:RNA polymerase sigma-70 factor (ECF subfamily)
VEEISQEIGVPIGTVKSRLARGRTALAPHLSEFATPGAHAGASRHDPKPRKAQKEANPRV